MPWLSRTIFLCWLLTILLVPFLIPEHIDIFYDGAIYISPIVLVWMVSLITMTVIYVALAIKQKYNPLKSTLTIFKIVNEKIRSTNFRSHLSDIQNDLKDLQRIQINFSTILKIIGYITICAWIFVAIFDLLETLTPGPNGLGYVMILVYFLLPLALMLTIIYTISILLDWTMKYLKVSRNWRIGILLITWLMLGINYDAVLSALLLLI